MGEPFDVSLRVRMRYEAEDTARRVTGDLDQIKGKATQLGAIDSSRLGRELRDLGTTADRTKRDVVDLNAAAARLGQGSGASRLQAELKGLHAPAQVANREVLDLSRTAARFGTSGVGRLGQDLRGVVAPAQAAKGEVNDLGKAAARFGSASTVSVLSRDLRSVTTTSQAAKREVLDLASYAHRLGSTGGPSALSLELAKVGQRADETKRKVAAIGNGESGRSAAVPHRRHEFANEAMAAAGAGGALRFGMAGAGLAGVATGTAIGSVGAGLMAATRQAMSFETAMADVRKAVDDLTPEKFAQLESTILKASRETGIAKEKLAGLVAEAGYAGLPKEDLNRFAVFGAKAAGAFNMPESETGDRLAKMRMNFKLTQEGIEDVADGINVLADKSSAKERQVIEFMERTSGAGKALRIAPLNLAAMGAAVIATGRSSEVAATGFNAFALKLGMADSQSKDFKQGLRAIGLDARRVKADMAVKPEETMLAVLEKINKLPQGKGLDVAGKLGGGEYADDLLIAAGATEEMRKSLARMQDQAARAGSVERAFAIFNDTTEGRINRASAAISAFGTKIGQHYLPAIKEAAKYTERLFGGMEKAMERSDRAAALASKLAKGGELTEEEKAEVEANPRLRKEIGERRPDEVQKHILGKADRGEPFTKDEQTEIDKDRTLGWAVGQQQRWNRAMEVFGLRTPKPVAPETKPNVPRAWVDPPAKPAMPGTGKRSDLSYGARVSLAAYTEEVESNLDRTERIVHASSRRMREDLAIKAKVEIGADRFGSAGGARIENAAYGGGGLAGVGGGRVMPPGRFGILAPGSSARGRGAGSEPIRVPSGRDAARYGTAGGKNAFGGVDPLREGGAGAPQGDGKGDRGSAATGRMMGYAMDQLRREGVPEEHLRRGAAQLVGQATMESGLDPNKVHDGGTGYGIYGARDPKPGVGRRTDMLNWLQKNGYAKNSAEGQMRFMAREAMSGSYPQTKRILMGGGSGDVERDTNAVTREFESPKVVNRRSHAVEGAFRAGPQTADAGDPAGQQQAGDAPARDGAGGVDQRQGGARHRRQPITDTLRDQLAYAGRETGVNAEVYSGGQDSHGRNRTGSHRHDHGQSADVRLYASDENGARRYLRSTNPADRVKMAAFMRAGARAGVTGIGHGPGYMGDDGIHMGGGSPLAWGAGGRSANAPDWVREAHRRGLEERARDPVDAGRVAAKRFDRAAERSGGGERGPMAMPDAWRRRLGADDEAKLSPRFSEPAKMQLNGRGAAEQAGGSGAGPRAGAAGPSVIQNFHGGFDEQATARRAVLEQNREVRRTQARALHDIGRIA